MGFLGFFHPFFGGRKTQKLSSSYGFLSLFGLSFFGQVVFFFFWGGQGDTKLFFSRCFGYFFHRLFWTVFGLGLGQFFIGKAMGFLFWGRFLEETKIFASRTMGPRG